MFRVDGSLSYQAPLSEATRFEFNSWEQPFELSFFFEGWSCYEYFRTSEAGPLSFANLCFGSFSDLVVDFSSDQNLFKERPSFCLLPSCVSWRISTSILASIIGAGLSRAHANQRYLLSRFAARSIMESPISSIPSLLSSIKKNRVYHQNVPPVFGLLRKEILWR